MNNMRLRVSWFASVSVLIISATAAPAATILVGDARIDPAGFFGGAFIAGHPGAGAITVDGGTTVTVGQGTSTTGFEGSPTFVIGDEGGVGSATIDGAGSVVRVEAGFSGSSGRIGDDGGVGSVTVKNGGLLSFATADPPVSKDSSAFLSVGRAGGAGVLTLDGGALAIENDDFSALFIGREGGDGRVVVKAGSSISIIERDGAAFEGGAGIVVGRNFGDAAGVGGVGRLTVEDSSVAVASGAHNADITAGRDRGTEGSIRFSNAVVSVEGVKARLGVALGQDSTGDMLIDNGSQVSVTGDVARLRIASFGADAAGSVIIEGGAAVSIAGTTSAAVQISAFQGGGQTGALIVRDGATLDVIGGEARLQVAQDLDSGVGSVIVSNGGVVRVDSTAGPGGLRIGAGFNGLDGGTGTLTVTGVGSTVATNGRTLIGGFDGGVGAGTVIVADGGMLTSPETYVGSGGVLTGSGGVVDGDVFLTGGRLAPGASPGPFSILGDLDLGGGVLDIEFSPFGSDFLTVGGDLIASSPFTLKISFLDGLAPAEGDVLDFLDVGGAIAFDLDLATLVVVGAPGDLRFENLLDDGRFAVRVEAGAPAPVPLPASAAFLIGGLALLGLRVRSRAQVAA